MNQQPPWQPQEPPNGQRVLGQQQWKQHLPPYQISLYHQLAQATPGQFQRHPSNHVPPPRRQSGGEGGACSHRNGVMRPLYSH